MNPFKGGWEPVAPSTQVVVLPFVAAAEGYLARGSRVDRLRITLHRVINREGEEYLQQTCNYLGSGHKGKEDASGRVFATDLKIIGAAFESKTIWRTKSFPNVDALKAAIKAAGETRDEFALSYLAVPFLSKAGSVVAILFADCFTYDFFSNNDVIRDLVAMGEGFCRLVDSIEVSPLSGIRNFPFPIASSEAPKSEDPAYEDVHENLSAISPPRFEVATSLNLDVGPETHAKEA